MTLKYNAQGQPYEDLTDEHKKLTRRVKELNNSLSIALEINDKFQRENEELKKELSRVKT
jgi:regulator of replication initiation timing